MCVDSWVCVRKLTWFKQRKSCYFSQWLETNSLEAKKKLVSQRKKKVAMLQFSRDFSGSVFGGSSRVLSLLFRKFLLLSSPSLSLLYSLPHFYPLSNERKNERGENKHIQKQPKPSTFAWSQLKCHSLYVQQKYREKKINVRC